MLILRTSGTNLIVSLIFLKYVWIKKELIASSVVLTTLYSTDEGYKWLTLWKDERAGCVREDDHCFWPVGGVQSWIRRKGGTRQWHTVARVFLLYNRWGEGPEQDIVCTAIWSQQGCCWGVWGYRGWIRIWQFWWNLQGLRSTGWIVCWGAVGVVWFVRTGSGAMEEESLVAEGKNNQPVVSH